MKMAFRSIGLISKKKKKQICTRSTLFFLISKATNLHMQQAFMSLFTIVLHDYNAVLYD